MSWIASLRKELLELARTHRLLVLAVVLVLFGLASPLFAKFAPEMIRMVPGGEDLVALIPTPVMADAILQYVKNVGQFCLLLAVLLTMGVVAQEKERGTAVLVLVKPLPRGAFLLSKFAALALAFLGGLALAGAGAYAYTVVLFEAPDPAGWLAMNLLLWLYVLVLVAITLLASTLARSPAAAAGMALIPIVAGLVLGIIPQVGRYLPGHLNVWGASLAGLPQAAPLANPWPALAVSVALIVASLAAAWLVLKRQEL